MTSISDEEFDEALRAFCAVVEYGEQYWEFMMNPESTDEQAFEGLKKEIIENNDSIRNCLFRDYSFFVEFALDGGPDT